MGRVKGKGPYIKLGGLSSRNSTILPHMLGSKITIEKGRGKGEGKGKNYLVFKVTDLHIGRKIGEFCVTRIGGMGRVIRRTRYSRRKGKKRIK